MSLIHIDTTKRYASDEVIDYIAIYSKLFHARYTGIVGIARVTVRGI